MLSCGSDRGAEFTEHFYSPQFDVNKLGLRLTTIIVQPVQSGLNPSYQMSEEPASAVSAGSGFEFWFPQVAQSTLR